MTEECYKFKHLHVTLLVLHSWMDTRLKTPSTPLGLQKYCTLYAYVGSMHKHGASSPTDTKIHTYICITEKSGAYTWSDVILNVLVR